MSKACNCCLQPPCPVPSLEAVNVLAYCNAGACHSLQTFGGETKFWKKRERLIDGWKLEVRTSSGMAGSCDSETFCSGSLTTTNSSTTSATEYTPEGTTISGSSSLVVTRTATENCDATPDYCDTFSGSFSLSGDYGEYSVTVVDNGDCSGYTLSGPTPGYPGSESETTYSTSRMPASAPDVITYSLAVGPEECELEFPAWHPFTSDLAPGAPTVPLGVGGYAAYASYFEQYEGVIQQATKARYRVRHLPTGSCYLKVWLRKQTTVYGDPSATPPVADAITNNDSETYVWSGAGNPCVNDALKSLNHESQKINQSFRILAPPTLPGTIQMSVLKWSCLEGYEPDISDTGNPQPNGFPDPTWEASPP